MPVSFNVPKQTPRSKYVIDTFQGVDFTSAGIDVDSSRSPYAPNMVRHTPGKVRKRMGYSKDAQFGTMVNVNLAMGTSSEEQNIHINSDEVASSILLYNLFQVIDPNQYQYIYLEFDYKSTTPFAVLSNGYQFIGLARESEWAHWSSQEPVRSVYDNVQIWSEYTGDVYIKNFSYMVAKDAKYKWSPAPEGRYILTDGDPYFYGRHEYRVPTDARPSIVNVNRAHSTHNEITDVRTIDAEDWELWTYLEEYVWTDGTHGRQLYIDFDYVLVPESGSQPVNAVLRICGNYVTAELEPCEDFSDIKHFSTTINAGSFTHYEVEVKLNRSNGNTASFGFGKLFIGYAIDENYEWSPSPEDNGIDFTPNVYDVGRTNYADRTEASGTPHEPDGRFWEDSVTVLYDPPGNNIDGFFYASATIKITSDLPSNIVDAYIVCKDQWGRTIYDSGRTVNDYNELVSGYKYEVYTNTGSADDWCSTIEVSLLLNSPDYGVYQATYSNIEVKKITPRIESNDSVYDVLHVGKNLFLRAGDNIQFAGNVEASRSWAEQLGDALLILDGKDIYEYVYGETNIAPLEADLCYIPTITIARSPSGGGTPYESINLLSPGFIDSFVVSHDEASATQFQLSFNELDDKTVKAWVLNSSGVWEEKVENIHFGVNRTTGVVTFATAPGETPISGQDNVRIQAYKTIKGYRDRIAKCRFGAIYGVNGNPDRLFVSGNPEFPNRDYFSEANNYKYFPDTNYSNLGQASGVITGYTKLGNYLGTFKKESEHENSLILREGVASVLEDGSTETYFRIVNTLQGEGPVSPYTMGYLESEPLYLTKKGIFAVTANDGTEKNYGQNRSYYLNGKLNNEPKLENGYSTVFNNMYILALNNQLYILDGLQPSYTENEPYSTKQYSAFYCDSIPATCIWSDGDDLYFGTADGKLCKFYSEVDDISSYNDDGKEIIASWETPDFDGYLFYKNKTFRYFAVRLMKAFKTSYKLFVDRNTVWVLIKEDVTKGRTFDFSNINFKQFSFITVQTEKIGHTKLRVKKVDKARFKIENSVINQPFGIYDLAFEYIENGNYKR